MFGLRKCTRLDSKERFYRDTWVEVDLDSITENVQRMKSLLPKDVEMIAVVKANGYGHGDEQVAKAAIEAGATYLAVAFMDEAISLRQKGIEAPILVLGVTRPEDIEMAAKNRITLTVFQEEWLRKALVTLNENSKVNVHIKIDTGMGRIGVRDASELKRIEGLILQDERMVLEGVFTHFASSDSLDLSYFNGQLELFQKMISVFSKEPKMIHAGNSAASLRNLSNHFNGIRYGIAMYGLSPSMEIKEELPFPLKEAFSLHTKLVHVKKLSAGEKISYGSTYEVQDEEWIGTLPIGYADGWIRKLQGQEVLVNGMRAPIVGRICMDQCMIKLPHRVEVGTIVTLIGQDGSEFVTVDEIAQRLDTINYEIPCMISHRVPRIYKKSGKMIGVKNYILE